MIACHMDQIDLDRLLLGMENFKKKEIKSYCLIYDLCQLADLHDEYSEQKGSVLVIKGS